MSTFMELVRVFVTFLYLYEITRPIIDLPVLVRIVYMFSYTLTRVLEEMATADLFVVFKSL